MKHRLRAEHFKVLKIWAGKFPLILTRCYVSGPRHARTDPVVVIKLHINHNFTKCSHSTRFTSRKYSGSIGRGRLKERIRVRQTGRLGTNLNFALKRFRRSVQEVEYWKKIEITSRYCTNQVDQRRRRTLVLPTTRECTVSIGVW